MEIDNRVVVLIDMDCFYCQVEEKMNPELRGKPIAVVQYNPWKGGGIIAVNYVARAMGVNRHMRGDEAKEKCPEINLPSVPCTRGKADITIYRDAGKEVARVLQKFTPLLERASIDEAYLDITAPVLERLKTISASSISTDMIPNTFSLGYDSIEEFMADANGYGNGCIDFDSENAKLMLVGALIVSEIRAAVYEETGYRCSAGISHNKILAKLVCGMNKPNKQTILPRHCVGILYKTLPLKKVKHLGGKFGYHVCAVLRVQHMGELEKFTEKELQTKFDEKNGTWLYNIARGINSEPVQARFNPKSIGCCKNFKGKSALLDLDSLKKWLKELGDEIEDRLEKDAIENNRTPRQIVISFATQLPDGRDTSNSRSYNFAVDDDLCGDLFSSKGLELVMDSLDGVKLKGDEKNRKLTLPIKFLGLSVGKFEDHSETKKIRKINDFFTAGTAKESNEKLNKPAVLKTDGNKENTKECKMDKKTEKDYIMKKFFQVTEKVAPKASQIEAKAAESSEVSKVSEVETVLQSDLEDQESFFAKFLHKGRENSSNSTNVNRDKNETSSIHPTNPICNVIECGENSNDSNHSSSTINNEINNSIALFEENPQDVERVSSMRTLLNKSTVFATTSTDNQENVVIERQEIGEPSKLASPTVEEFQCPDCKKMVKVDQLDTHSDYHLALKLRDEERQEMRMTKAKQTQQPAVKMKEVVKEEVKTDTNTTIANFFEKIDENVPMKSCRECGRKIKEDKFMEHLDFHEAQKLSRELNKKTNVNNFSSNSVKRKRKSVSPVKKPKLLCKSIDSFFK